MTTSSELIAEFRALAADLEPAAQHALEATVSFVFWRHLFAVVGFGFGTIALATGGLLFLRWGLRKGDEGGVGAGVVLVGLSFVLVVLFFIHLPGALNPLGALIAGRL